jgi:hypothetical protein
MNPHRVYRDDLEIVVIVEGITALTSDTIQSNYSYMPSDIVWNRRMATVVTRNSDRSYSVDFSRFHDHEEEKESFPLSDIN